ncbi:3'-5' exonuclease [Shimia sp.]|uniref:3'-5' exonuclease n=1 Tax=Shimia sp. TaxID=1954381 RepID=UPI003BAC1F7D
MHVMIDLETMDTAPSAAIVAIGACRFDHDGIKDDTFYRRITLQSSVNNGGTIGADTVIWWLKKSDAVRQEAILAEHSEHNALRDFRDWLQEVDTSGIWGNGAMFDNAILGQAYRRYDLNPPWPFWADLCYRTMKSQSPHVKLTRKGTHHNALDDAMSQAQHLIEIWNHGQS